MAAPRAASPCDPPACRARELEALSRRYMQEMIPFVGPQTDVMAPDMGTNEQVMAWFMDTYSMHQGHAVSEIVTGKPVASAAPRAGARRPGAASRTWCTAPARRSACAVRQHRHRAGLRQRRQRVRLHAARRYGVKVIGVSDHTAALFDPAGLPLDAIEAHVAQHGVLAGFTDQMPIAGAELLDQRCDILVPAAMERVITAENAGRLQCRILAEGANGPDTPDADDVLDQRRGEVFVIPDILCNSGGVIVSYFEWVQDLQRLFWTETEVNHRLEQLLDSAFTQVRARAAARNVSNRTAAMAIGVEKVRAGKRLRGLFP